MKFSRFVLAIVVALVLAAPAFATWKTLPNGEGATVEALSPTGTRVAYYDWNDTTDSALLIVEACAMSTYEINSDLAATTTGGEGYLRSCVGKTASVNECNPILTDAGFVTLNGDFTTGRARIYRFKADRVYWDVTANAGSKDGRGVMTCD